MNSLFHEKAAEAMRKRLQLLEEGTVPRWGSFTACRMVGHLAKVMDYALHHEDKIDVITGPPMFIRHLIRLYLPWPKGAPTRKEMLETDTESLADAVGQASALLIEFSRAAEKPDWPVHPFFGQLDGKGWAKLMCRHNNYHLKQFGV